MAPNTIIVPIFMFVGLSLSLRLYRLAVEFPAEMFGSYWDCGTEVIVNCMSARD